MTRRIALAVLAFAGVFVTGRGVAAAQTLAPQDRLCDPTFENCRADVITYIQQETVAIDMAFWAMTDARYSNALVAAWQRGVKIRLLVDPRCAQAHPACQPQLDQLAAAGIPMRQRITGGILHWKCILFAGQQQVEFAGANYSEYEMTNVQPYVNFTDEVVAYSHDPAIVGSFMTKFDDLWTSTTEFADYANVTAPLQRRYPTSTIDPQLNFPPDDSYRSRAIAAYRAEPQAIDVLMFRITDEQESDGMIAAVKRGVPVRLISDTTEYRNPDRLWHAYNVDKMYTAGVQVRLSDHQGINHEKAVILHGKGMVIFGSSNWTSPSTESQREHNLFTTQPWMFTWLDSQFTRKWTNGTGATETKPFVPLPPDIPTYRTPADGTSGIATSGVALAWDAGPWAHLYDIYFGTTANPPLLVANVRLGPSQYSGDLRRYSLPQLQPATRYYWKIVSRTMASVSAAGPVWSFTTSGTAPSPLPSGWSNTDIGATGAAGSSSYANGTFSVTGAGADVWGSADALQFAYATLTGDGAIVARVTSIQDVNDWTKAGVMIRNSLPPSAAEAFMLVAASSAKGAPFQRRTADGGTTVSTSGSQSTVPHWVKLERAGNTISGYESSDGSTWTLVGSDTFVMGPAVLVGLAVSSHVPGTTATAAFDSVSVTVASNQNMPTGWSSSDIGATGAAGSSSYANGTFSVTGAGADVWGSADALQFAYGTLTGDGSIVARVTSIQNVNDWTKAGVMIRNSLSPSAADAFMLVAASPAKGAPFQRRTADGGSAVSTSGSQSTVPHWVKLERTGNTISGYESSDGANWTLVGSDTFVMGPTVLVGLAVSSHVSGTTATATFDSVSVTGSQP